MRCTRAGDADRAALRALWKQAFGDGDETIDAFFDTLFPLCDAFAAREGEDVCAMLFCLPQTLAREGHEEKAAYIYAVATDERWRHRGACRGLLQYAEKKLKSRGVVLLMDTRYGEEHIRELLPPHWRVRRVGKMALLQKRLKDFWNGPGRNEMIT